MDAGFHRHDEFSALGAELHLLFAYLAKLDLCYYCAIIVGHLPIHCQLNGDRLWRSVMWFLGLIVGAIIGAIGGAGAGLALSQKLRGPAPG